jgi:hypothetical protein
MQPRFSELNKVSVISEGFGEFEGYVIASRLRDGRWIYKISISEDPKKPRALTIGYPRNALSLRNRLESKKKPAFEAANRVVLTGEQQRLRIQHCWHRSKASWIWSDEKQFISKTEIAPAWDGRKDAAIQAH